MSEYYEVFLIRTTLAMQDPDLPGPRFHTTIFVKTGPNGNGTIHEVTGDITSAEGMYYTRTPSEAPELSPEFYTSQKLGVTQACKHPDEWQRVLDSVPTPPQQKAFNMKTMKTEPFKTKDPLTFYQPGEPRRPLNKCTEWTIERAIPALKANGLIIEG
ncbi:hypothetical protein BDV39DRAFT_218543 [Aspergillus sergii]|uniref:Uncharacterized protein n=1 Tax=Aspergillus sergii TaxID=1034303 RepID=A0A5N6WRH8_9EURO|nr:hypothetical protein BDV39DRAFT_218543 [Aspergillus sergii]